MTMLIVYSLKTLT